MKRFAREAEPDCVRDTWKESGRRWAQRRIEVQNSSFNWGCYEGQSVHDLLVPPLKRQTLDHCSFCDAFPVCPPSDETIEHFLPKSEVPLEAYHWPNLYYCCRCCQRKNGVYSDEVLRPDAPDYDFDRYFRWDFTLGRLNVNPGATAPDQVRALKTIEYFRLNVDHPRARLKEQRFFRSASNDPIDGFAYRHFVSPSEDPGSTVQT